MPYCRKCGTKLDETARFCHVCGTPVAITIAPTYPRQTRRHVHPAGAFLIALLVFAVAISIIVFLPLQPVSFNESTEAARSDVNSLNLTVDADSGNVNIYFRDLPGNQRAIVNVSATGWRGIFGLDNPIQLTHKEGTEDTTLTYTAKISTIEPAWFYRLTVTCNVYVDPQAALNLSVHTDAGQITLVASNSATFQGINLDATAGSVQLIWGGAKVSGNIPVNLKTTSGSMYMSLNQTSSLSGNVTLNAEATVGGIFLQANLRDEVGAKITANTNVGGVSVNRQQGFSGNQSQLQSANYPGGSNFVVNLKTETGGISINADYEASGVRS